MNLPSGQMSRWYPLITSTRGSQRNCNSSDMPSWSRDHRAGRKFPKQTVAAEFGKSTFVASLTSSFFEFEGAVHGELQQQLHWQRYEKRTVGRRWARMNSWVGICVCVQWYVSQRYDSCTTTNLQSILKTSILGFDGLVWILTRHYIEPPWIWRNRTQKLIGYVHFETSILWFLKQKKCSPDRPSSLN